MKVGVSTASLFLRKNNEEALPLLNDLGVATAEVFLTSFCEYEESFAKLLQQRKGEMAINSIHILNAQIEPQLFSAHDKVRGDSFYFLQKALASARILGAPYYTFHGTARYKKAARNPDNDDFAKIGKRLQGIVEFCDQKGVSLCLENVEWSTYNRVGVFSKLKEYVPQLKGVLDLKQARVSGYSYTEYLTEMGQDLAYAHISDIDSQGKIRLPGQGVFDFEDCVKRLQDVGFDGALLIEVYNGDYQKIDEIKTSCEFLQEILYKNNALK